VDKMQVQKNEFYNGGFPKHIQRNKHNLPINDRLKEARLNKGLSLTKAIQELSYRGIKCGVSTLQGYEANENSLNHRYPSIPMLLALSDLYDCSTDFLFGISDRMKRMRKQNKKLSSI
jgi:transcriptional regulator with XRE-family HTH domain